MKNILIITLLLCFVLMGSSFTKNYINDNKMIDRTQINSIYQIELNDINNNPISLKEFKNKKILIVNTASKCGFTYQYESLQKLHQKYKDKIVVIGVPSNDFMNQEPGSAKEIVKFCKINYGVDFILTEKMHVKGVEKHTLFQYLTQKSLNGWNNSEPTWNFNKFLIDENGYLINKFGSTFDPLSNLFLTKMLK